MGQRSTNCCGPVRGKETKYLQSTGDERKIYTGKRAYYLEKKYDRKNP